MAVMSFYPDGSTGSGSSTRSENLRQFDGMWQHPSFRTSDARAEEEGSFRHGNEGVAWQTTEEQNSWSGENTAQWPRDSWNSWWNGNDSWGSYHWDSRWDATGSEGSEDGRWFKTPQCWVWGRTLDEGIERAVQKGWVSVDRAFCAWWAQQGSASEASGEPRPAVTESNSQYLADPDEASDAWEKGKKRYSGKEFVPEHDGEIAMREYERRVRIWQSTSSISEEYQAGKLLERLHGEAWKAAETLEVSDIRCRGGVEVLLKHLWEELEPLEYLRVFQTLSYFYDSFHRVRGQEMTQYDTAFRVQCQRLAEAQAPLEGRAKAFWFLRKAGISEELRRQVVSSAGGVYDYARLRSSLVAIVPQVHRHDGDDRKPQGHDSRRGRSPTPHKVHAVLDDGGGDETAEVGTNEPSSELSAEDLEMEAEVLLTTAARKRSEFHKNRGFNRSESPQSRERRISEMKSRMPCSACKAAGKLVYGHWHSDPECPEFGKKSSSKPSKSVFVVSQPDGSSDSEDAFLINMICLMASAERLRRASYTMALTDTCCARTVAGEMWVKDALTKMDASGIPYYMCEDHQPFKFGDGPRVVSKFAVLIPVKLKDAARSFVMRISAVKEDVPLLLSAQVLRQLGAVLDMENNMYEFRSIQAKINMVSTETGHIGFKLFEDGFLSQADLRFFDWEAFLQTGEELRFFDHLQDQGTKCSTPNVPGSIHERGVRFNLVPEKIEYDSGEEHVGVDSDLVLEVHLSEDLPSDRHVVVQEQLDGSIESRPEEEERLCAGTDPSVCIASRRLGAVEHGKVEMDLPVDDSAQGDQSAASELEEVQQRVSDGIVLHSGPALASVECRGSSLCSLEQRSIGLRDRELCLGAERERLESSRGGGGKGGGSAELPSVPVEDGGEAESPYWRRILRMCGLSSLPRNPEHCPRANPIADADPKDIQECLPPDSGTQDNHDRWNRRDGRPRVQEGNSIPGISIMGSCFHTITGGAFGGRAGSHSQDASPEVRDGEQEMRAPDPPEVIREKIRVGNAKRRRAKVGTCKRLLSNCRSLVFFTCMLTLSAAGQVGSQLHERMYGSSRPDVVEIFGGCAEVSMQFAKRGWSAMEPCDVVYGDDLRDASVRKALMSRIRSEKPRLAVISYPCRFWSKLTDVNFRSSQQKRRLNKLRRQEEPFLELCEEVFEEQISRGDDALAENPLCSLSFSVPPMQRVLRHPKVYIGVGHGCRFNMRSSASGLLLKKPTLWISTSPELCDELALRCINGPGHVDHHHGECQGGNVTRDASRYTPEIGRAVHRGFLRLMKRKDPHRITQLLRAVKRRLADGNQHGTLSWGTRKVDELLGNHEKVVCAVESDRAQSPDGADAVGGDPYESSTINPSGIDFVVPPGQKLDKTVQGLLRKLHCNLGHPSQSDLQRFMRSAGASQDLVQAVGWLRCSSCAKSQRPRLHRTCRIPPHNIQFNDQVLLDCFYLKDVEQHGYWFLSVLDRATMYHQIFLIDDNTPSTFLSVLLDSWVRWAGVPGEATIDMERGFGGEEFSSIAGESGIQVVSIAGQAHWQHGKIERHGAIAKDMLKKVIIEGDIKTREHMYWAAIEVSNAKNALIREHGFSPSQLVFGRDPRNFGELEENGEPCAFHFSVGDRGSQVAMRMKYRQSARQAFVKAQATQMLNRTARNRTRAWEEPRIGDRCFFFREVRKKGIKGKHPTWLGPALVVGIQGQSNYWLVFGGRCFLVSQEQIREAVGEEALFGKPEVQEAIGVFQEAKKKGDVGYLDLTENRDPKEEDLDAPMGDESDGDDDDEMVETPVDDESMSPNIPVRGRFQELPGDFWRMVPHVGWHEDQFGNPVLVSHRVYSYKTPINRFEGNRFPYRTTWAHVEGNQWALLEKDVRWVDLEDCCEVIPGGPFNVTVTVFQNRSRKQICEDSVPFCIKKKQRVDTDVGGEIDDDHGVLAVLSKRKLQKSLDKEIPFSQIPHQHVHVFKEAEQKEWDSWVQYDAVEVLDAENSQKILSEKPERVLRSRFVYRDKNAGLVDESGIKMPIKAKARLCVQGQHCPDCATGLVKVDAPTVQHGTWMMFLHLTISWGWLNHWRSGDISSAFLQGAESTGEPLYMFPPQRGLPGIGDGQIMRLKRPVYGRPDAPRAWYEALSGFIMNELGFEKSVLDPALFIHRNGFGVPNGMLVVHVDDLMVATNGDSEVEQMVGRLYERFPFGEWSTVKDQEEGITYCGKEIVVEREGDENVIRMRQRGFVEGRLDVVPIEKSRKGDPNSKASPSEVTDFRSVLGAVQWLSTQSRPDVSFMVNQLQKRVNDLRIRDLEIANQVVRIVKKHEVAVTFRNLGKDFAVVAFHDAGLYNSVGVEIEDDDDDYLHTFEDKRLLYSQKGCLVGLVKALDLERTDSVPFNVISWKTKSNKRIVESSFAGETHAALMGYGSGHYVRMLLLEISLGSQVVKMDESTQWFDLVPLIMATDCKSVYDCIRKDGQSVGDKGNAINVAVLRQLCSTDIHPRGEKSRLLWVPTRHQLADPLTKSGKSSDMQTAVNAAKAVFHGISAKEIRNSKRIPVSVNLRSDS